MRRDGGSVFPAHANTGDPNGPDRGLSANQNARALIPMMARSKCSNQRPDTLMQDRRRQFDEILLQRTAGPYIGSQCEELNLSKSSPPCPNERTSTKYAATSLMGQERTCRHRS